MKCCVPFLLSLGILSVVADTAVDQNKNGLLSDTSDPNSKQLEEKYDKGALELDGDQEAINVGSNVNNKVTDELGIAEVVIQVEESMDGVPIDLLTPSDANSILYEEPQEPHTFSYTEENEIIHKDPDEIMETAAGFVPIPIIRKRQKQRRRFPTRRNFNRNPYPYRRFYFYPNTFYYPSSLRFY